MKNLILILAVSATLFSCSADKLTINSKAPNTTIQASTANKNNKVSFASQIESTDIEANDLPKTENSVPEEAAVEASTTKSIAKYMPVYAESNNSVTANLNSGTQKLTFRQRLKIRAIKAIVGVTGKQSKASSELTMVGTLLNKFSFWFGLISIIAAIFLPGLGLTLGILGLIFGITGTTISSSNKETGMLGILLSAVGILLSIVFSAIYNVLFFND